MELGALRKRLDDLELLISGMAAKLDLLSPAHFPHAPPGLEPLLACYEETDRRLDTLEKVYVLIDWIAMESSAKKMGMLATPDHENPRVPVFDMTFGEKDSDTFDEHSESEQRCSDMDLNTEADHHNFEAGQQIIETDLQGSEHEVHAVVVDRVAPLRKLKVNFSDASTSSYLSSTALSELDDDVGKQKPDKDSTNLGEPSENLITVEMHKQLLNEQDQRQTVKVNYFSSANEEGFLPEQHDIIEKHMMRARALAKESADEK